MTSPVEPGAPSGVKNLCAGPFGAVYDAYIERPWLSRPIARLLWGIDVRPLYRSIAAVGNIEDGSTILDVACGGGVALRGLRSEQQLRYIASDISERMLERVRRKAQARGLAQVETVQADVRALPFDDGIADVLLFYSGLHEEHENAVEGTVDALAG